MEGRQHQYQHHRNFQSGTRLSDSDSDSDQDTQPQSNNKNEDFNRQTTSVTENVESYRPHQDYGEKIKQNYNSAYKRGKSLDDSGSDDDSDDNSKLHKKSRNESFSSDANADEDNYMGASNFNSSAADNSQYSLLSSKGAKMMKTHGYQEGMGLGKTGEGRLFPVELYNQSGRKGLGFEPHSKGQGYEGKPYNPELEEVIAEEKYEWLTSPSHDEEEELSRDILDNWLTLGPTKKTIDDEINFCDPQVLYDILSLKTALDKIKVEDFLKVRSICNPYEKIGGVFFMNRAAMKMANMDAAFDFMFTSPKKESGEDMVNDGNLLYFADVCAGPGGFTEYVLWRKKWLAKGFGFTLKSSNDFKISDMLAAPTDSFTPYYGVCEDGNIFSPENLKSLKEFVLRSTEDKGVHFLMADGGFDVQGDENIQEIMSKQLYLCQCIAALSLVRTGGHFVVKLFDLFTEFSVGLIYLMYKSFKHVCIHKPHTSRPANSERYLICKWKKPSSDAIERFLFDVNKIINEKKKDKDVKSLVPLSVLREDAAFYKYLYDSNNSIGIKQKNSLLKIIGTHNKTIAFEETRHLEMRRKCLELWKIPDRLRSRKNISEGLKENMSTIQDLIIVHSKEFSFSQLETVMGSPPSNKSKSINELKVEIKKRKLDPINWSFVFLSEQLNDISSNVENGKYYFYLGCDSSMAQRWTKAKGWSRENFIKLPVNTLIIAERVKEYTKEGRTQMHSRAMHIIDAYCLGGIPVFHQPLPERYKMIKLFCDSVNKNYSSESNTLPLRCKKIYNFSHIDDVLMHLERKEFRNRKQKEITVEVPYTYNRGEYYFKPEQILLFRSLREPFVKGFSEKYQKEYYFDTSNGNSTFDMAPNMISHCNHAFINRIESTLQPI